MKNRKLTALVMAVITVLSLMCVFAVSSAAAGLAKITTVNTAVSDTKAVLSWTKVTGAQGYQVFQYNSAAKTWTKVTNSATTKVTVTGLSPATDYIFKVRSYRKLSTGYDYSPYSGNVTVKTILSKPATPTATAAANSVTIKWTANKNALGYQVEFYDYAKSAWVRKRTVTTNSVQITGLENVKSYKFRIRAYNNSGKLVYSPYSDVVYFTTTPAAATGLKIGTVTAETVSLSWNKVPKVTGYYVYVNEYTKQGVATSYKVTKSTAATSITLSLKSCTYYRFRILPYFKNSSGKNIYGAYATSSLALTAVGNIKNFTAVDVTNNSATLTWATQVNATGYMLYERGPSESSARLIATLGSQTGAYKLSGLKELSTYRYYIKAYHTLSNGSTRYSATAGVALKTDDSKVDSLSFVQYKTAMYVGTKYVFKAQVAPSYAANQKVAYGSKNTAVATVTSSGVVTAVAPGTTYIIAKSYDGGFYANVKLTVKPVKSTAISVPSQITLYMGETGGINPTFTPANTTDKSFTITGSDYTYTYKGFLGLTTKTDTCKFSDYVTTDSLGRLTAKKVTVEPETGNRFSFNIIVRANDSGVYTTAKLTIAERKLRVEYNGSDTPWYYGNSAKLNAVVSSNAGFSKENVLWQSSDRSIATVSADGTVSCVGVGKVTISAISPDGSEKYDYEIYCASGLSVSKTYFEQCKVSSTYAISAAVLPSASTAKLYYTSMNPDIVSVDSNGVVKFLKQGTGTVVVSVSDSYNVQKVVFTSGKWTAPSQDMQSLFSIAKSGLNSIKAEMPAIMRTDSSTFTNFIISDSSELTPKDFEEIFAEFAKESEHYIDKVNTSTATNEKIAAYRSSLPVEGQPVAVLEGLGVQHMKSVTLKDSGSYTYDIVLVLNNEYMATTNAATLNTAHGKIFDILSSDYINYVDSTLSQSSMDVSFSNFAQNYNNSSVTVTVNKATGLVENVVYDMNINIVITKLNVSMSFMSMFNSDLAFSVNNKVKLQVQR